MKLKPYMIVGLLFIAVFLGVSLIGQAIGFWHLPGQATESEHKEEGSEHNEGEKSDESAAPAELHGYMNLKEFLTKNGVDLECVAAKLGVTVDELNIEAKEIAHGKGFEMEQIQEFAKECKGHTQAPSIDSKVASTTNTEIKTEDKEETPTKPKAFEGKTTAEIIDELEKGQPRSAEEMKKIIEEAREKGEQLPSPDEPSLPFLKGSDKLDKYCTDNGINMDCLSEKLGIPVSEFSKTAKEVASKLSTGHVEQIRELLPGCFDYSR